MYCVICLFAVFSVVPTVIPLISESWDYNLFIRLNETEKGYVFPGQLLLESRGIVIALPGRIFSNDTTMEIEDRTFTTPCCRSWTKTGWAKVHNRDAVTMEPLLDYSFTWENNSVPPAEIWALKGGNGSMYSPTISSTIFKYNRNNITVPLSIVVAARLSIESSIIFNLVHADGSAEVLGEMNGNSENAWMLQRLHHQNTEIQRNTDVRFEIIAKQPVDWVVPVLIQWVSISAPTNQRTINFGEVISPEALKSTYFTPLTAASNVLERDPVCLHGGEIDVTGERCKCQSGFTGTVCERGCGANRYGLNCGARCSSDSDTRHCRGIFDCLREGCKCMPGLEGAQCDQACHPGWYGNNCEQECGHCAGNEPCDRFTGRCDSGCEDGFQTPFCKKESCGLPASSRTEAASTRNVFFHSAIYEKKKGTYRAVCSASLISSRFLLSAAWCFYSESSSSVKSPARFLVLFGTDVRFEFTESTLPIGVQAQSVASLHLPQLYRGSQRSHADDVALVEIVRPVRTTIDIAPVCMDVKEDEDDDDELLDGDVGYVVGWGNFGANCTGCTRNVNEIEYVTHSTCLNEVSESLLVTIGPEKFCGHLPSENVDESNLKDFSDVGSGYMYYRHGGWFIYGVKSASAPDTKHKISAYTSVRNYADWILTKMNDLDVKYAVLRNT